jgi:hypothetical protein
MAEPHRHITQRRQRSIATQITFPLPRLPVVRRTVELDVDQLVLEEAVEIDLATVRQPDRHLRARVQLEQLAHLASTRRLRLTIQTREQTLTAGPSIPYGDDRRQPLVDLGEQWPGLDDRLLHPNDVRTEPHDRVWRAEVEPAASMSPDAGNLDRIAPARMSDVDPQVVDVPGLARQTPMPQPVEVRQGRVRHSDQRAVASYLDARRRLGKRVDTREDARERAIRHRVRKHVPSNDRQRLPTADHTAVGRGRREESCTHRVTLPVRRRAGTAPTAGCGRSPHRRPPVDCGDSRSEKADQTD